MGRYRHDSVVELADFSDVLSCHTCGEVAAFSMSCIIEQQGKSPTHSGLMAGVHHL